jgi:hypothetical protein
MEWNTKITAVSMITSQHDQYDEVSRESLLTNNCKAAVTVFLQYLGKHNLATLPFQTFCWRKSQRKERTFLWVMDRIDALVLLHACGGGKFFALVGEESLHFALTVRRCHQSQCHT